MTQTIQDLMTPNPITLPSDSSATEAARVMRDNGVGDVIVTEGSTVFGILTDRDIVVRALADGKDPGTVHVGDIASRDVTCLTPDSPVEDAVRIMRDQAVRRLPVVEDGRAVGIVSLGDLAIEHDPDSTLAEISSEPPNR